MIYGDRLMELPDLYTEISAKQDELLLLFKNLAQRQHEEISCLMTLLGIEAMENPELCEAMRKAEEYEQIKQDL